ncbi:hypothetical protein B5X24_HaOG200605 [Helicoverpa armigera]|nr:hypothetical protein B5X24_HaOG200605 [Helicoverpa armigera]
MLSKLLIIVTLLIIISKYNNVCAVADVSEMNRHARESLFAPLDNFITDIKYFFNVKINEKRKRIKSAINKFFEELSSKRSYNVDDEYPMKRHNRSRTGKWTIPTNAEDIISAHGYKSESHTVLTADGYMMTIQRVLPDNEVLNPRVVILHHGLYGSSDDWLLLGCKRALPYLLIDNGFDVWLLNSRGNKYSKTNTRRYPDMLDFWEFSWHEMGVYDLPAAITYISEITHRAEMNFIGHSMGATALLVLLSTIPKYNNVLRSGILLCPLAFMYHAKGPLRMLANFYRTNGHNSLRFLGQTEFKVNAFTEQIVAKYCKGSNKTCQNSLLLLANGGEETVDRELMSKIRSQIPAGGSIRTLLHYVQLAKSGYFQRYDYGAANNFRVYGNVTPTSYNLRRVTLPIALFSSPADWLSTVADLQTLMHLLQEVSIHHVVKAANFGHFDFIFSPDAPELVYNFIIKILNKLIPKRDPFFQ